VSGPVAAIAVLLAISGCVLPTTREELTPGLMVEADETGDRIMFKTVPAGLGWSDLALLVHDCGPDSTDEHVVIHAGSWSPYYNQAAARSGLALNDPEQPGFCAPGIERRLDGQPRQQLAAGDFIEICASNEHGAHDLGIAVVHAETGQGLGGVFFAQLVQRC